jgi:hypothetical protein
MSSMFAPAIFVWHAFPRWVRLLRCTECGEREAVRRCASEISPDLVANSLFSSSPDRYEISYAVCVSGGPRRHSPIRAIPGVLSGDLDGLIGGDLLTSRFLRRVA